MAVRPATIRVTRSPTLRAIRRGGANARRTVSETGAASFLLLVLMALVFLLLSFEFPDWWPLTAYVLPLLLAMNMLSVSRLLLLEAITFGCLAASVTQIDRTLVRYSAIVVVALVGLVVLGQVNARSRLGVGTFRGESMLVDLRDRLASQSRLPELPRGWYAQAVIRSAGGASFAGDFVVATITSDGDYLEVVVVDVSGKGINAGTRALQLSGAFGGLLGSLDRQDFLPAANEYLLRQQWSEGFATAVHLAIRLSTGEFEVRTAGHPPAVQFHAGSGKWSVQWTEGPVLGILANAQFGTYSGTMSSGDALLLYTDGLVEMPQRDISYGIDKLLGEAERLVPKGFERGAERLVASIDSANDDRAILLLHRR
ncbi:MAG: SpoIIE family protein phosphatase [Nocardioidaceae bacterium]